MDILFWLTSSLILSYMMIHIAQKFHFLDHPDEERKIHTQAIAYGGGFAISLSFITALVLFFDISHQLLGFMIALIWIVILGAWDDKYKIWAKYKLLGQIFAGGILAYTGTTVSYLTNPLTPFIGGSEVIDLSNSIWISWFLTILWVVILTNALNLIDSLDGLASSIGILSSIFIGIVALDSFVNQPELAAIAFVFAASIAGFLPFNWKPAKIFLGDSGSMAIGLVLATLSLYSGWKIATAALVLAIPLIDILWAVIRRLANGQHPFSADRNHLHHVLLDHGWGQEKIVLFFVSISAIMWILALNLGTIGKIISILLLMPMIIWWVYRQKK